MGGGGIGYDDDETLRCYGCGARVFTDRETNHLPGCRYAPRAVKQADGDPVTGDFVSDLILTAAVDELMSSDTSSNDTTVADTSVDSSTDISSPDTGSDFGGFDGGDSGGGGVSGDF